MTHTEKKMVSKLADDSNVIISIKSLQIITTINMLKHVVEKKWTISMNRRRISREK